jgi:hypothetical protein
MISEKFIFKGLKTLAGGHKYQGFWTTVNGEEKEHGLGVKILRKGIRYEGYFNLGSMEGMSRIIFPNGDLYEGENKNGLPNGYGKFITADGVVYKGNWKYSNRKNMFLIGKFRFRHFN